MGVDGFTTCVVKKFANFCCYVTQKNPIAKHKLLPRGNIMFDENI